MIDERTPLITDPPKGIAEPFNCESCAHFFYAFKIKDAANPEKELAVGNCKRYPPTVVIQRHGPAVAIAGGPPEADIPVNYRPQVLGNDTCGDWETNDAE